MPVERDLETVKGTRRPDAVLKVCSKFGFGGFLAMGGSTAFCILWSVWETNKLNGINPFDILRLAFEGKQLRISFNPSTR